MGEVPMTGMAGEALTAPAVETIVRSGAGLVTGRAGGHRPTLPRPPFDFADSALARESRVRIEIQGLKCVLASEAMSAGPDVSRPEAAVGPN